VYTKEAMAAHVEGKALYRCTITLEGKATNCRTIKALPFMEQAVRSAVESSWRYAPISFQGRPVSVDAVITVVLKSN
jgi:periplasmic protein TonB